ncbi:hypothetical protein [Sediminicola sp. 1XM1-17]|uniref:hypothetical protein n=1 Tax=Sediminicola sp. 1XM1-17 TaxID=3127702 RepID=UPI0030773CA1
MECLNKITGLILVLLLIGCGRQKGDAAKVLNNEAYRVEIMEAIINDDEMVGQFLDRMIANEEAKLILVEKRDRIYLNEIKAEITNDTVMAGLVMEHMMNMMQEDSTVCRMMCRKMGNNPHMKGMMMLDSTKVCPMHN